MGLWNDRVLPRVVDRSCGTSDIAGLRGPVCAGLHGDVLELGFGSGHNVPYYPAQVRHVAAVEPSDLAWRLAARRLAASPVDVRRAGLDGQRLDLPDGCVDTALTTFTLCTIPDVDAALAEVRRVLRPGGTLHYLEHGLAPDPGVVRWQRRLNPVQRRVGGGCRLDRPIVDLLERAGFAVERDERFYGTGPKPLVFLYAGSAIRG